MSAPATSDTEGWIARLRRLWRERDLVTVCIPAYQSADVIADTLRSIAAQTYRNIRVLISLDPSNDDTDKVCEPFLADPRFSLIRQERQLGWTGNTNYLLDQVRSKYYCIVFHDDWIEPRYIARLMKIMRRNPSLLCAYPLLEHIGRNARQTSVVSLIGSRFDRVLGFFRQPLNSVPIRGLTRSKALHRGLRLREMGTGGFLAEWVYTFELALLGNSKRVGRTSYYSRARAGSVSTKWQGWSAERKRAGWRAVLKQVHAGVTHHGFTEDQQRALLDAALAWSHQLRSWLPADRMELAAIADPVRRAELARAWRDEPDGSPPFL
jgi:glycosyltransferase involved in cell wall biosynthesis